MASEVADLRALAAAIDPDDPCGPDLDLEGDPAYFGCVSRVEGLLPAAFFTRDDEGRTVPFDRSLIPFPAEQAEIGRLLARSRDLRLVTLTARLSALNRDLGGVAAALGGIVDLLGARWEEVHPRGEGGDFALRGAVLAGLDDMPTMVLPLQQVTLATSRRHGPVTFRHYMVADGEAQPSSGDPGLDRGALDRVLAEADIDDLRAVRERVAEVAAAAAAIGAATTERLGYEGATTLDRLPALAGRILATLDSVLTARELGAPATAPADAVDEPAAAAATGGTVRAPPPGAVADAAAASRLLAAVSSYFARLEPSSPARPLVLQARSLVGLSFVDAIRTLVPARAEEARIALGTDRVFSLSLEQLGALAAADGETGATPFGEGGESEPSEVALATRREAIGAMGAVSAFYRTAEPSSPVPLLLDRAASLAERDFMALLKDVLPELFARPSE